MAMNRELELRRIIRKLKIGKAAIYKRVRPSLYHVTFIICETHLLNDNEDLTHTPLLGHQHRVIFLTDDEHHISWLQPSKIQSPDTWLIRTASLHALRNALKEYEQIDLKTIQPVPYIQ